MHLLKVGLTAVGILSGILLTSCSSNESGPKQESSPKPQPTEGKADSPQAIVSIVSYGKAFAALRKDGSVITWGDSSHGGDTADLSAELSSNVKTLTAEGRFAAIRTDGSVVLWPRAYGYDQTLDALLKAGGTKSVASNGAAVALLKEDGSVITWGLKDFGGDSSNVAEKLKSGVKEVISTGIEFIAIKDDGSVVTWGTRYCGSSSPVADLLSSNVKTGRALYPDGCVAIKNDGSVVAWGLSSSVKPNFEHIQDALKTGVVDVVGLTHNYRQKYAALKTDGSVVTWGETLPEPEIAARLTNGVISLVANDWSFAALKSDGSVVTWPTAGGGRNYGEDSSSMRGKDAVKIIPGDRSFTAILRDGSLAAWGVDDDVAGIAILAPLMTSPVVSVTANTQSDWGSNYVAQLADGRAFAWGSSLAHSPDYPGGVIELPRGSHSFVGNMESFAGVADDGSLVAWGFPTSGGDPYCKAQWPHTKPGEVSCLK